MVMIVANINTSVYQAVVKNLQSLDKNYHNGEKRLMRPVCMYGNGCNDVIYMVMVAVNEKSREDIGIGLVLGGGTAERALEGMGEGAQFIEAAFAGNFGYCHCLIVAQQGDSTVHLNGRDKGFRQFARGFHEASTECLFAHIQARGYMSDAVFTPGQTFVDGFYHQPFKVGFRIGDSGIIFR